MQLLGQEWDSRPYLCACHSGTQGALLVPVGKIHFVDIKPLLWMPLERELDRSVSDVDSNFECFATVTIPNPREELVGRRKRDVRTFQQQRTRIISRLECLL